MVTAIRQEIIVQKNHVIEIHSSALKPGTHVEVILLLEEDTTSEKNYFLSLLGTGKGSFSSPEEADTFIRRVGL